jgi:hypothetical protein
MLMSLLSLLLLFLRNSFSSSYRFEKRKCLKVLFIETYLAEKVVSCDMSLLKGESQRFLENAHHHENSSNIPSHLVYCSYWLLAEINE